MCLPLVSGGFCRCHCLPEATLATLQLKRSKQRTRRAPFDPSLSLVASDLSAAVVFSGQLDPMAF